MNERILITGGTGLVGKRLSEILTNKGYHVSFLTRSAHGKAHYFEWDIEKGIIDDNAIVNADHIVHLAGASVAEGKWSPARKKEIIDSRVKSAALLLQSLQRTGHKLKSFISASGTGIYGLDTADAILTETSPFGKDFLADVCVQWEQGADNIAPYAQNIVKLRIGVVLAKNGGALKKMIAPFKFGIASALGSGKQYLSWIHIDDLCNGIEFMISNQTNGVVNMVAGEPVTNLEFTKTIAKVLRIPIMLPNVPSVLLKLLLGEMSGIVLGGNRVSNKKLTSIGYKFTFNKLEEAIKNFYQN